MGEWVAEGVREVAMYMYPNHLGYLMHLMKYISSFLDQARSYLIDIFPEVSVI